MDVLGPCWRFEVNMIAIDIPGWGNLDIENVVFDLNGTLAKDGKILPGVKEKIHSLSEKVKIYILTADTQGTANEEMQELKAELVRVSGNDSKNGKLEFLRTLRPEATVAIGNGNNDQLILKESGLGIAVLEREGMSLAAMKNADLAVKEISDAFDLLLRPKRLIATLRE
jgi:soluble P-type ATPase